MSTRIHIIVSEEEKALFCTAAGDVPLSRWIKKQCLWAAQNQQLDGLNPPAGVVEALQVQQGASAFRPYPKPTKGKK